MNSRSLTLALRLLTTACAGAALGTLTGCPLFFSCPEPWSEVEEVELGTDADILALAQGGEYDELVAVGVGGVVVHYDGEGASLSNPTNVTLRGVAAGGGPTVVVGDGGTILRSEDRGASWTTPASGVADDLLAIVRGSVEAGLYTVAIAAEQVLYSTDEGETWTLVTPPAQGWGGLRAVFVTHDQFIAVGAGGVAWAADDPAGAWLRQELGTEEELFAGGRVSGDGASSYLSAVAVVSTSQVYFREADDAAWTTLGGELDGEIAAFGGGYLVTINGTIYDVEEDGGLTRITNVGLASRAITGGWDGFVVAGEGGNAARAYFQECVGGRPWMIDGRLATAALIRGATSWASPAKETGKSEGAATIAPALREQLAAAWAQDGLYEHASVASFARVVLELMSLGAPPELVLASRAAIVDELDHARRCFELASRYAGAPIGPGALPLPPASAPSRAGDPEAIALAVFEDGCINESVAAAEAAVAAAECRDPRARAALERIAADERSHAALAWKSLRWLLDTHGLVVAPALRRRLASLGAAPKRTGEPTAASPDHGLLREHGRLSAKERATIQRDVFARLVIPLARELLGGRIRAQA